MVRHPGVPAHWLKVQMASSLGIPRVEFEETGPKEAKT